MCGADFFMVNSPLSCGSSKASIPFHYIPAASIVHDIAVHPNTKLVVPSLSRAEPQEVSR